MQRSFGMDDAFKNVSRETIEKLEFYQELLVKWQKAVNLVSVKTLPDAWRRHFADSAQLSQYLCTESAKSTLVDLGSGAGFPGMVLAMMRPDLQVHLIESDEKKCHFLKNVSRETKTLVSIHNARIEEVYARVRPDLITARALAPLEKLLAYTAPWREKNPHIQMCFPKGEKVAEEVEKAKKTYDFKYDLLPSETDPKGKILKIQCTNDRA